MHAVPLLRPPCHEHPVPRHALRVLRARRGCEQAPRTAARAAETSRGTHAGSVELRRAAAGRRVREKVEGLLDEGVRAGVAHLLEHVCVKPHELLRPVHRILNRHELLSASTPPRNSHRRIHTCMWTMHVHSYGRPTV